MRTGRVELPFPFGSQILSLFGPFPVSRAESQVTQNSSGRLARHYPQSSDGKDKPKDKFLTRQKYVAARQKGDNWSKGPKHFPVIAF